MCDRYQVNLIVRINILKMSLRIHAYYFQCNVHIVTGVGNHVEVELTSKFMVKY